MAAKFRALAAARVRRAMLLGAADPPSLRALEAAMSDFQPVKEDPNRLLLRLPTSALGATASPHELVERFETDELMSAVSIGESTFEIKRGKRGLKRRRRWWCC